MVLDALAEGEDRLLDRGAARVLLLQAEALALGRAARGDILVRGDPAAALHRPVDGGNHPSGVLRDLTARRLAVGKRRLELSAVGRNVAGEGAGRGAVPE